MHRSYGVICQKSERIPLVTARCVALKGAAYRAAVGGILGRSAFVLADKNGIVVLNAFKNRTVCNAVLYDRKVNPTPEKVVGHSVTIMVSRWQEQYLWLVFGCGNRRRLPVCRNTCEHFHGFHKAILPDLNEIIKGRNTAETSRPPVPLTIGNLQAVVFFRAIDITCHTL